MPTRLDFRGHAHRQYWDALEKDNTYVTLPTLFACLFATEMSLLLSSSSISSFFPPALQPVLPSILAQPAFLQIRFLHRVITSLSIGLTQLAGIWVDKPSEERIMAELQSVVNALQLEGQSLSPTCKRGTQLMCSRGRLS